MSGHNAVVNCVAVNEDGVMVSMADNGSINFWDYDSGYSFQQSQTIVQPGSLDAEAGIFAAAFDLSGRYVMKVYVMCGDCFNSSSLISVYSLTQPTPHL